MRGSIPHLVGGLPTAVLPVASQTSYTLVCKTSAHLLLEMARNVAPIIIVLAMLFVAKVSISQNCAVDDALVRPEHSMHESAYSAVPSISLVNVLQLLKTLELAKEQRTKYDAQLENWLQLETQLSGEHAPSTRTIQLLRNLDDRLTVCDRRRR